MRKPGLNGEIDDGAMRADAGEDGLTRESMLLDENTSFRPIVVSLDIMVELLLDPRTAPLRIILRHDNEKFRGATQ
jgi:hypothetical protein